MSRCLPSTAETADNGRHAEGRFPSIILKDAIPPCVFSIPRDSCGNGSRVGTDRRLLHASSQGPAWGRQSPVRFSLSLFAGKRRRERSCQGNRVAEEVGPSGISRSTGGSWIHAS